MVDLCSIHVCYLGLLHWPWPNYFIYKITATLCDRMKAPRGPISQNEIEMSIASAKSQI